MDMDYSATREAREASQEAMKRLKRLNRYREMEEYNDAINKLPIDERFAIKDVLHKIRDANLDDKLAEFGRKREREREMVRRAREMAREEIDKENKVKCIGIMCMGALAYVCATIITR